METNNQIHSFIRLVMNENLAQAQGVIRDTLNEKLNAALDEKFEAYAPVIFEELDPVGEEDEDVDNDGDEDESDGYLNNRREKVGAAVNGEEETNQSAQPVQNSMPQIMPQSGGSSSIDSDGY